MWIQFGHFGQVINVFVPTKKLREGKSFGFVRCKRVADAKKVVREVPGVDVGPNMITFNIAKFGRDVKRMME